MKKVIEAMMFIGFIMICAFLFVAMLVGKWAFGLFGFVGLFLIYLVFAQIDRRERRQRKEFWEGTGL